MQKFANMEHSNSRTFQGPTLFSTTFKGLDFFPKINDFQGLLKDPMNPEGIHTGGYSSFKR